MYKVRLNVEPKFITADSEVRLYLSIMPMWRARKSDKVYRDKKKKAIQILYRILISGAVTIPSTIVSIQLAYLERGYWAIGGEYLFSLLVFLFYFKQSKYFVSFVRHKK